MHLHLHHKQEASGLALDSLLGTLAQQRSKSPIKKLRFCVAMYMDESRKESHAVMESTDPTQWNVKLLQIYNEVVKRKGNATFMINEATPQWLDRVKQHFKERGSGTLHQAIAGGKYCVLFDPMPYLLVKLKDGEKMVVMFTSESALDGVSEAVLEGSILTASENPRVHYELNGGDVEMTGGQIPYLAKLNTDILRVCVEVQGARQRKLPVSVTMLDTDQGLATDDTPGVAARVLVKSKAAAFMENLPQTSAVDAYSEATKAVRWRPPRRDL